MADPFIASHTADELDIAGEFLTNWLPFLTRDLCDGCSQTLTDRIKSLRPDSIPSSSQHIEPSGCDTDLNTPAPGDPSTYSHIEPSGWGTDPEPDPALNSPKVRMSWADMAQEEDELALEEEKARLSEESKEGDNKKKKVLLSRAQREWIRFQNVGRKKDFISFERVKGKFVNILDGLELHTGVFSAVEQKRIVDSVYELQERGRRSEFRERTYSEPQKWMRGKGRVTIQFGCCYNYALDKDGNPPGILHTIAPDPIPPLFKDIIKRMVRWHVLPASCTPDSCIVNIYEPGDCIPPHIDSHDFVRPFSTVSFLSECNMLFGSNLKIEGPGEFSGSTAIPLPVGSVLVLNGNGADVAKHCVPAVPTKRISITFRKMDESKHPNGFIPEPDLGNLRPLSDDLVSIDHQKGNNSNSNMQINRRGNRFYRGGWSGGTHTQSYDNVNTPVMRPRQTIDVRSTTNNYSSMGRGRDSSHRQYDSEPRPFYQDIRRQRDDYDDEHITPEKEWEDEGSSGHSGSNGNGRRVMLDQKRIVISRNIEGEDENINRGSYRDLDKAQQSRGPYKPQNAGRRHLRVLIDDD